MGRPWFPLYAADLLVDAKVASLKDDQFRILFLCWCRCCLDGSIPTDPIALGKVLGIHWRTARTATQWLPEFFVPDPTWTPQEPVTSASGSLQDRFRIASGCPRWVSQRMIDDEAKYRLIVERNRINGAKGGRPRKPTGFDLENPLATEPQPQPQLQKEKKVKTTPRKREGKPDPKSLEEILGGGKGTPTWESYWKLVTTFGGQAKNPAPRTTAALYTTAIATFSPEQIQAKAEALRSQTSEARFMPQLLRWLEGHGFATPDLPKPSLTVPNGAHHVRSPKHRAEIDAAYIDRLSRQTTSAPCPADDPELHSLFEAHGT
jgi:hypothetical protein